MNQGFPPTFLRPNVPLRRPSTEPGPPDRMSGLKSLPEDMGKPSDVMNKTVGDEKNNSAETLGVQTAWEMADSLDVQTASEMADSLAKLCNYCSQPGHFRCTRCIKTSYCSAKCQSEDWKAHRRLCKPAIPETISENEPTTVACNTPDSTQVKECDALPPKRVYSRDLRKNTITKDSKIQGTVISLKNPGKFYIHPQSEELIESMKNLSKELDVIYSTSAALEYKPDIGELCAVKFPVDRNWYRAEVLSVSEACKTACVFYIDFGGEVDVAFNEIRPLSERLSAPPLALQCCIVVKPVTERWTDQCTIAVQKLVAGKTLTFTVVDINNGVLVVDVALGFDQHLSSFLLDQGYASQPLVNHDINSLMMASLKNYNRSSGEKNENSDIRTPDPLTQAMGDSFIAIVTHLQSPSEILVQKLENAKVIQELQNNLQKHCNNTPASENFRPPPESVCCSLFSEDGQWYRAKVLAYSSENCVCVGYIDFGNSEEVELLQLRPISYELLALETQVIPCSLAGIKPVSNTWSEDAILQLKHLVCNRFIRVMILGKKNGRALVSMIEESSDSQTNIAELLLNGGLASKEHAETESAPVSGSPVTEKLEWNTSELPLNGQKVELVICSLTSPAEFYCYNYNTTDSDVIKQLFYDLLKHCQSEQSHFSPTVGEPCCALFGGIEDQWCRVMVQEVQGSKAIVDYVDLGNSGTVEISHLKPIIQNLLKLPFLAIRCWIAGVEPANGGWNEEAAHKFQDFCGDQQLSGRVLSVTEKGYGIELENCGRNIASMLISQGLAVPEGQKKPTSSQPLKSTNVICTSPSSDVPQNSPMRPAPPQPEKPTNLFRSPKPSEVHQTTLMKQTSPQPEKDTNIFRSPPFKVPHNSLKPAPPQPEKPTNIFRSPLSSEVPQNSLRPAPPQPEKPTNIFRSPPSSEFPQNSLRPAPPQPEKPTNIFRSPPSSEDPQYSQMRPAPPQPAKSPNQTSSPSPEHPQNTGMNITPPQHAKLTNQTRTKSPEVLKSSQDQGVVKANKETYSALDRKATSAAFPLNWKSLELTCKESFKPRVAAVISPSLFYILNPGQVNAEALGALTTAVSKYCSMNPDARQCLPFPGAACCAQFSGDKVWYRAIVLEISTKHARVIYADYGNVETLPVSAILPITSDLLQLPFQIVRCALSGKDQFPAVWSSEVLELFGVQLSGGVRASVQGFDGTSNLLTLSQKSGQADGDINSIILQALQKENTSEKTTCEECSQITDTASPKVNSDQQACCCLALKQKIDHIEELVLDLVKHLQLSKK